MGGLDYKSVGRIMLRIFIVILIIPMLIVMAISGIGLYYSKVDPSGQTKYSIFPVFGNKILPETQLERLYEWYNKDDVKGFLNFVLRTGLPVNQITLVDFLKKKNQCYSDDDCIKYIKTLLQQNKDLQVIDNVTNNNGTDKIVYLPNPFVGKPIAPWNSYYKENIKQPLTSDTDYNWYTLFTWKIMLNNLNKYWEQYNSVVSEMENLTGLVYTINKTILAYPNIGEHCWGHESFKIKGLPCFTTTDNTTNSINSTGCNLILGGPAYNSEKLEQLLFKYSYNDLTKATITRRCITPTGKVEEKKLDADTFLNLLGDSIVYYTLSTTAPLTNAYSPFTNKEYGKLINMIYKIANGLYTNADVKIQIKLGEGLKEGIVKYFNSKWFTTPFQPDLCFNYYNKIFIQHQNSDNVIPGTGQRQAFFKVCTDIINSYKSFLEKSRPNLQGEDLMKTIETNIENDWSYLKTMVQNVEKTKIAISQTDTIQPDDIDKLFDTITITTAKGSLLSISDNSIINGINNFLQWMFGIRLFGHYSFKYNEGILIVPVQYKGLMFALSDVLKKTVLASTLDGSISLNKDARYTVYYLIKSKAYEQWEDLSTLKKFVIKEIYELGVPFLTLVTIALYIVLFALVMLNLVYKVIGSLLTEDALSETGLSLSELAERLDTYSKKVKSKYSLDTVEKFKEKYGSEDEK